VSFAAEEKYVLEKGTVHRVRADGKRQRIEDVHVMASEIDGGAKGSISWFAVDPDENDAMQGSKSGIYFFDEKNKPLFFMPFEYATMIGGIFFSDDGKQMLLDVGTWVVRNYILYDFKGTKGKTSFMGMTDPIWLDPHRFAFTMVEPDAEPRPSETDFDGWTSVVVYDTAIEEVVPVIQATETKNYLLTGVNWEKDELEITETSVKNEADWVDHEKHQNKKITAPFPAAG
jgi:hypothetical protein